MEDHDPGSRNTEGIHEPFDSAIVPLTRHSHGARFLINRSAAPCCYRIIGGRQPHDVSIHADTGRVSVKLTGEAYRGSATMDYWEGVEVGAEG